MAIIAKGLASVNYQLSLLEKFPDLIPAFPKKGLAEDQKKLMRRLSEAAEKQGYRQSELARPRTCALLDNKPPAACLKMRGERLDRFDQKRGRKIEYNQRDGRCHRVCHQAALLLSCLNLSSPGGWVV